MIPVVQRSVYVIASLVAINLVLESRRVLILAPVEVLVHLGWHILELSHLELDFCSGGKLQRQFLNVSVILTLVVGLVNEFLLVSHFFLSDLLQVVLMIICLGNVLPALAERVL